MRADSVFAADDHRTFNRNGEAFDKGETFSGVPYEVALEAVAGAYQQEVAISFTNGTEGCTVSGWSVSCGYVCTATTECGC